MENNFISATINWRNADVHCPKSENGPIVYCTTNKKVGTLKSVRNQWEWLKEKYSIKWWCYQSEIVL